MFNVYVKIGYLRPADSLQMQNPYKLAGSERSEQSVVKEATPLCLSKKPAFGHDSGGSVCCAVVDGDKQNRCLIVRLYHHLSGFDTPYQRHTSAAKNKTCGCFF